MNYPKEVKEHMKWAKNQGFCTQCIYPWFDGICECGNSIKYKERMNKIAEIAIAIEDQHYKLQKEKTDKWLEKRRNQILKKTVQNPKWISKLNKTMSESI